MEYQYPDVRQKMAQVIFELINKSQFLGVNVVSLELVETTFMPFPMAVNSTQILYNPEILLSAKFDNRDLRFILAHEAMHVLQKAPIRITQYQQEHKAQIAQGLMFNRVAALYNIANDLAINSILVNDGWEQPDKEGWRPCVPGFRTYKHLPPLKDAEWYFEYLMRLDKQNQEQQKQQQQQNGGDDESSDGEDQEDQEGDSSPSGDDEEQDDGDAGSDDSSKEEETSDDDDGEEDESENSGDSGSGRGKGKRGKGSRGGKGGDSDDDGGDDEDDDSDSPDEVSSDAPETVPETVQQEIAEGGRTGQTEDGQSITELTIQEMLKVLEQYPADILPDEKGHEVSAAEINQKIALSIGLSGGYGNQHIQSCMERMLSEQIRPAEISWKRALRMYLTARDHSATTYRRPSRRRDEPPMFFPSRNSQTLGNTFLVADVSGSMYGFIQPVVVELHSLFTGFRNTNFTMVLVDTAIRYTYQFRKGVPIPKISDWKIRGFGSTDMTPGFVAAEKSNPSLLICSTDLEFGGYFPPKPRCPVIWIVPDTPRHRNIKVPYGNVVYFNPTQS